MEMTVYGYCYNPCTYESGEITISLHRTKAGAWRALRRDVWEKAVDGRNFDLQYGGEADHYREPGWVTHRVREFTVYE